MSLFLYIDRPTFLHRLNPIVKVLGMLCFFVAAFVTQAPSGGAAGRRRRVRADHGGAGVAERAAAAGAVRHGLRDDVRHLDALLPRRRAASGSWGPVRISAAGLRFALGMAIKLDTFLGVGIVFLSTTKIEEFAYALTRVGMPYKLGFTMTLAFRLVPVFLDAAATVVQAQRCRGFNFDEGNLWQRMRRYVPVIVPVFMGALRRADGMAMALEARGFQAQRPRTAYEQYRFEGTDALVLLMAISLAVLYVALWYVGQTTVPTS